MQTQMLKGILEGCVLKIVEDHFHFSKEILEILNTQGFDHITEGTIFPLLIRLEKEDLFEIKKIKTEYGHYRKYYRLNKKGIEELKHFEESWNHLYRTVNHIIKEG